MMYRSLLAALVLVTLSDPSIALPSVKLNPPNAIPHNASDPLYPTYNYKPAIGANYQPNAQ